MSTNVLAVNLLGIALIAAILWYFVLSRSRPVRAEVRDGVQGALIVVKGGYTPDTIVLTRGRPARLVFRREEEALCSERVILSGLDRSAYLHPGEEVTIEFTPTEPGDYAITCQLGVLRGRIVVE